MPNEDIGTEAQNAGEDKTSTNNDQGQQQNQSQADDNKGEDTLETLKAQKNHWRENAIDPETGKKYKELYEEAKKSQTQKEDKTSKNEKGSKAEEFGLLQRTFLASNGVTNEDEIALAKEVKERTGLSWEQLPTNEYFKFELEKHRETAANAQAANVDGGGSGDSAVKEGVEYWEKKGTLPTSKDIPDRSKRVQVIKDLKKRAENQGGTFYNE